MEMLHAIIMAGGSGTRFWPASRKATPKQLLDLLGGRTMIQSTVDRLGDLVTPDRLLVVTNEQLVESIAQQLPEMPAASIIGEPCKRDTAPCIGLAAAAVQRRDEDATMIVMPADHVIQPTDVFRQTLLHAVRLVEEDAERIVTFGIPPAYPAEIYGYIEKGDAIPEPDGVSEFQTSSVVQFREKPDAATAQEYLESGNFYWNSGIFVWKATTVLDALRKYEPEMHDHIAAIAKSMDSDSFAETLQTEFAAINGKSIDYAVLEKYPKVVVVEAPYDWDDVGNWQALARMRGADDNGNTVVGKHLGISTAGSIIRSDEKHLVVTVGITDCIVVHTPNATLVANRNDEEAIRLIVKQLEEKGWTEYL
ncbi:MAG: mannose-1-phosphate guanylyltransferase [Pirellulaceae bacterium]|jgi:mannose-1-phosphate guanylyltransferase